MKSQHTQLNTENPTPAWCRKVLRLLSDLDSVAGAVVGLEKNGLWKTYTVDAEDLTTEEIIQACEHAAGKRPGPSSTAPLRRSGAGAPLRDPEGGVVGALFVFAAENAEIHPSIEPILKELAGIVAPFVDAPRNGASDRTAGTVSSDPAFMLRVFGKIQPLVSEIVGFSDVLQREVIGTSRKRAEIIHKNGTRVIRTLKGVLDLVELESGVAAIESSVTDLAAVARDALESRRPEIRKRGLRLDLHSSDDRIDVDVDEQVLRRILGILLSNAIQYTAEGGVTVIVDKTMSEGRITVRDTGRGIRKEFIPKLFEPFSSDDAESSRHDRGIGMGLALARRLATQIGVSITVDSRLGEGSSFTLRVPLIASGGDTLDVPNVETDVRLNVEDKPLILFVEDNAVARRVIEMMIQKQYDVVSAATVDEALERAREYQFDLLLLDIALNERRTGVEVLQSVRKMVRYRDVPAVACTAYSLPGLRERYLEAGFDSYIAKPFRAEQILKLLGSVLETGRRAAPVDEFREEIEIELPPLPGTLPKMLELISEGEDAVGTDEVTRVLESDPVAASWVLGHVNSAFYSVRGQVTTVDRAVTLLGGEPICNLVISGLLAKTFDSGSSPEIRRVHEHIVKVSLGTAGFARELATAVGMENPELAFTAGLMHDIGRMSLLAHDAQAYTKLWVDGDRVRAPELGQELLNFGIDHVSLGLKVSRKWSLPPVIHAVIDHYEDPDRSDPQHRSLASLVAVARAAALELLSEEAPQIDKALEHLEDLYECERDELRRVVRDREQDVRSLMDAVRLG